MSANDPKATTSRSSR